MGPDGLKYYTREEDSFYLQRELKMPPELRYKIFKDAPYWDTPENAITRIMAYVHQNAHSQSGMEG